MGEGGRSAGPRAKQCLDSQRNASNVAEMASRTASTQDSGKGHTPFPPISSCISSSLEMSFPRSASLLWPNFLGILAAFPSLPQLFLKPSLRSPLFRRQNVPMSVPFPAKTGCAGLSPFPRKPGKGLKPVRFRAARLG